MIKIICIGSLKESYWRSALEEYKKRLTKYTSLEIIELKDEGLLEKKQVLKKEKEKILKVITPKDYIITLEIEGSEIDSVTFSKRIDNLFLENSVITFIIGGSYGLDPEIKSLAKESISFSKMTFPHQLFRIMLLEQIYRAFKIKNNESYHK